MKLIFPVLCQEVFNCEQARVTTRIILLGRYSSESARTHPKDDGWKCEGNVPETKVRKENSCLLYDDEKGSLIYAENSISGKVIVVVAVTVCATTPDLVACHINSPIVLAFDFRFLSR